MHQLIYEQNDIKMIPDFLFFSRTFHAVVTTSEGVFVIGRTSTPGSVSTIINRKISHLTSYTLRVWGIGGFRGWVAFHYFPPPNEIKGGCILPLDFNIYDHRQKECRCNQRVLPQFRTTVF